MAFEDVAILFMAQKTWQTASKDMRTMEMVSHKYSCLLNLIFCQLMPGLSMLRTSSRGWSDSCML